MKKVSFSFVLTATTLVFITGMACKKKTGMPEEKQGVHFQYLLKTVLTGTNSPTAETAEYSYDGAGRISLHTIRNTDASSGIITVRYEQFHRSATGHIDSITWRSETNGVIKDRSWTYFIYHPSGQLNYSKHLFNDWSGGTPLPVKDSSVYNYSGSRVSSRSDYRKHNAGPYNYIRSFSYDYDAAGNLTALGAVYTNPAVTDTIRFTYDNKINPLPVLRGIYEMGYWGPAFYDDFHLANNLLTRRNRDWDPMDFEYRYSANNKPLYQKIKTPGITSYSEMKFYYD